MNPPVSVAENYDQYFSSRLYEQRYPRPNPSSLAIIIGEIDALGKRVLDVGCGNGRYAETLLERTDATIVACDISREAIDGLSSRCSGYVAAGRLRPLLGDPTVVADSLGEGEKFDLAIMVFGVLGHIYPRSRRRCARLFAAATIEPDAARADVLLGRALHVLLDMACPAHAQNVWHYLRDPFERYVDAHAAELAALPLAPPPPWQGPEALIDSLAGAARAVRADRRQTPWGKLLRRDEPPLPRAELAEQASLLLPLAGAHARVLVEELDRARLTG